MSILRLTRVPDSFEYSKTFIDVMPCHNIKKLEWFGIVVTYVEAKGLHQVSSSITLHVISWDWPSHWPQNPMILLDLLASKGLCLAQQWDYRRIPHLDFIWVIGTQKSGLYKFYRALFQLAHLLSVRHFTFLIMKQYVCGHTYKSTRKEFSGTFFCN